MNVKIKKLNDKAVMPQWNNRSAGCDLSSTEDYTLKPGERHLFKTGLSIAIPTLKVQHVDDRGKVLSTEVRNTGLYGRIAPRSGLAYKSGIDVMAGVIDEDYRGEIGVILINLGQEDKVIATGDKIAQLIFENYTRVDFEETDNLDETARGAAGYGSTDTKKSSQELLETFKQVQADRAFRLGRQTTIDQAVRGHKEAESIKSYLSNFQGEIYLYEENGRRGLCIVDSAGTIQTKYIL